eukprot:5503723-Prymnesium_polylepis.1
MRMSTTCSAVRCLSTGSQTTKCENRHMMFNVLSHPSDSRPLIHSDGMKWALPLLWYLATAHPVVVYVGALTRIAVPDAFVDVDELHDLVRRGLELLLPAGTLARRARAAGSYELGSRACS